jgi:signal transduction histidine kinase
VIVPIDGQRKCSDSSMMLQSWRVVILLISVGLALLLVSVAVIGRDLQFVRSEAEGEVLALAETGAMAMEFAPGETIDSYLKGLLKHPAIAMATVYSSSGKRPPARRPLQSESSFIPMAVFGEPVVGCRAVGTTTLCLEADSAYYRQRVAALVLPHAALLAASALLLIAAVVLGRGRNNRDVAAITAILRRSAAENNYAVRVAEAKGETGDLARAVNALLEQMHQRELTLRRRTTELEAVNREAEAFSYSVSHDLRSPLASVDGFSQALSDLYGDQLDDAGREYLRWIQDAVAQMNNLVAGLLQMSRMARSELNRTSVNLAEIAGGIAETLRQRDPSRKVDFRIEPDLVVDGDPRLLHAVLENLMSNAYKFTGKREQAIISVGSTMEGGRRAYFVKDNGAGFDSTQAARMFTAFQRLHSNSEFEGTGIGLSTVKRIIERHGGAIWADGQVGEGATFYFTLGDNAVIPDKRARELTSV